MSKFLFGDQSFDTQLFDDLLARSMPVAEIAKTCGVEQAVIEAYQQSLGSSTVTATVAAPRKRGRPAGTKNKAPVSAPKKRGRPVGSKNSHTKEKKAMKTNGAKKRGRPVGSKNKVAHAKRGRPVGSKNKTAKRGRPLGSKNKTHVAVKPSYEELLKFYKAHNKSAKRGRPVGSKNKTTHAKRGRPAGVKSKVQHTGKRGRPAGTKNKTGVAVKYMGKTYEPRTKLYDHLLALGTPTSEIARAAGVSPAAVSIYKKNHAGTKVVKARAPKKVKKVVKVKAPKKATKKTTGKRGRPVGSKNKPKVTAPAVEPVVEAIPVVVENTAPEAPAPVTPPTA